MSENDMTSYSRHNLIHKICNTPLRSLSYLTYAHILISTHPDNTLLYISASSILNKKPYK